MVKKLFLFSLLLLSVFAQGQDLTATMKMPDVFAPGQTYEVECTIVKGAINSYIKFSQKLPPNFKATEVESKGGNFSFDDSIVRVVWFFPPAGSEFTFSYKIQVPEDEAGERKIGGKIYYFYNTNREVFSFERKNIYIGTSKPEMVTTAAVRVNESSAPGNPTVNELNAAMNSAQVKPDTVVIYKYVTDSSLVQTMNKKQPEKDTAVANVTTESVIDSFGLTKTTLSDTLGQEISVKDTIKEETVMPVALENKAIDQTAPVSETEPEPEPETTMSPVVGEKPAVTERPAFIEMEITPVPPTPAVVEQPDVVYSIQLGSFKFEVPLATADKFLSVSAKGIKNLKEENGYTTFVVGRFKTKEEAMPLKEEMVQKGFPDAYIIPLPAQKQALLSSTTKTKSSSTVKTTTVQKRESKSTLESTVETKKAETAVSAKPVVKNEDKQSTTTMGKTYRVQIGAFREEVPLETANKFLQLAAKGVKHFKDNRGYTLYTVGDFLNRENAEKLKLDLVEKGFKDAFIVTFENGEIVR